MAGAKNRMAKYVYGIVRATGDARPRVRGIGRKQVRVVRTNGLGALTSDVPPGDLEAGRDELLAHARVLERALEQGVVLPMRFGVVMDSEDSVREDLLNPNREALEAQLEEMDDKVEVNVKAIYDEATVLSEVVTEQPEIAKLRAGLQGKPDDATYYERIRLGELIAEAVNGKRERDANEILDRLGPHAVEVEVGEPIHERMALNASFLIERPRLKAFNGDLDEIASAQRDRLRFKYTGPLAPHSFVELAVEG
jgi:Gas vesicle synthesis protein GvpL/GvpF